MTTAQLLLPDPKVVRKLEKEIAKEAREDEKGYQRAVKDLKSTEKSEAKAAKAASKAEKNLKKLEDREYELNKSLQKATHKRDQAATSRHNAEGDLEVQTQYAQKLKQNVEKLKLKADQLFKAKESREEVRTKKLNQLHVPPPATPADDSGTVQNSTANPTA